MDEQIDTGDSVLHEPSGETWLVARVRDDKLAWMGWPPGWANLSDCKLVSKASDAGRQQWLKQLSESGHHCADWAKERLASAASDGAESGLSAT